MPALNIALTDDLPIAMGHVRHHSLVSRQGANADIDTGTAPEDLWGSSGLYTGFATVAETVNVVSSSTDDDGKALEATGSFVVEDYELASEAAASGTITFGAPEADDTVTVDGETFTFVESAPDPEEGEFTLITELTALIDALPDVAATDNGTTITITAAAAGEAGNSIGLSVGGGNSGTLAVSGANLTGGQDNVTITIGGIALTQGTHFTAETSDDVTAANIATAINEYGALAVTAEASTDTITLTAEEAGAAGNSITLATSNASAVSKSGNTMGSGADGDGTGARTLRIDGLDASYEPLSEVVEINGTSAVDTVNRFLRVFSATVVSAGSGGANAGTLTLKQSTTTSNVFGVVAVGANHFQSATYTIPAGKRAYLRRLYVGVSNGASSTITAAIRAREYGELWQTRRTFIAPTGLPFREESGGGVTFGEKADIALRVTAASGDNTAAQGGFDLVVVGE